jgi:hypothetical protein
MNKKEEFIKSLSEEKKAILLQHFNGLRKKKHKKLTKEEYKITYLAWMWKTGMVTKGQNGFYAFNEDDAGIPLSDYEDVYYWEGIYFPGSNHLESIHMQYELDRLISIV